MTIQEFNLDFEKNIDQLEYILKRKTERLPKLQNGKVKEAIRVEINVMSKALKHFNYLFSFCKSEQDSLTAEKKDLQKQIRVARHYLKSMGVNPVTLAYLKESDFPFNG